MNVVRCYFDLFVLQIVNKKCTEKQTAKMIEYTAVSTGQRKENIQELVKSMEYKQSNTLAEFGVKFVNEQKFLEVPARKLNPPKIEYSNGMMVTPNNGQWRMQIEKKNMNFLKPANCLKWCILNTDSYLDLSKLDSFVGEVCVYEVQIEFH